MVTTVSVTTSGTQQQNKDGSDIVVEPPGIVAVQWRGGEPDSSSWPDGANRRSAEVNYCLAARTATETARSHLLLEFLTPQ